MFCAHTKEIYDADKALCDILSQLKIDENLLENSIGVVSCDSEFAKTGVLKAICKALPFDTIGINSVANGTKNAFGKLVLTICVITASDSFFAPVLSDKIENDKEKTADFCKTAAKKFKEKPKMILSFVPFNLNMPIIPETILNIISQANDGIANFGAIACSYGTDGAEVIFNGETYGDRFVFAAFCGKINPKFVSNSIAMRSAVQEKWLITQSNGNLIKKVNNSVFDDFLKNIKIPYNALEGIFDIIPFWFDFDGKGKYAARAVVSVSDEGFGVCTGEIPTGVAMTIGKFSKRNVVETAENLLKKISKADDVNGVLLFSSRSRLWALGSDDLSEMKLLQKYNDSVPHFFMYSAGEYYSDGLSGQNGYSDFSIVGFIF